MLDSSGTGLDALRARPLGSTFGAEITGMPIAGDVPQPLFDAFVDLFHRYRVVLVRDLSLSPEDLVAFSRRFGALEFHSQAASTYPGHPEISCVGNVERDGIKASFARGVEQWHADSSFRAMPSAASLFYGETVPPEGGDTLFADATAAYATLPPAVQQDIDALETVHSLDTLNEWGRRHNPHRAPLTEQQKADFPPVRQKLVRTHPATGRARCSCARR